MPDTSSIAIPGWLAKVVTITCGFVALIITAAIPWASNVASNIAEIKTEVAGNSKLNAVELQYLSQRLAVNESETKELRDRVRDVEHLVGTKRTASRPISD